jgi:hypothetical protein
MEANKDLSGSVFKLRRISVALHTSGISSFSASSNIVLKRFSWPASEHELPGDL